MCNNRDVNGSSDTYIYDDECEIGGTTIVVKNGNELHFHAEYRFEELSASMKTIKWVFIDYCPVCGVKLQNTRFPIGTIVRINSMKESVYTGTHKVIGYHETQVMLQPTTSESVLYVRMDNLQRV